eukprot:CAMPEP_0197033424 /NCGR_PEP_ID=MMETSP1384-20130603/11836_1 /TAXON_ID=29189 /ORGANISM="Ammonia sp." /LENGTH=65 /DNA_ID=CAMNT_0042463229 /DNA_START=10 /DNA_END=203 /DNA_ORIENTATION=+
MAFWNDPYYQQQQTALQGEKLKFKCFLHQLHPDVAVALDMMSPFELKRENGLVIASYAGRSALFT